MTMIKNVLLSFKLKTIKSASSDSHDNMSSEENEVLSSREKKKNCSFNLSSSSFGRCLKTGFKNFVPCLSSVEI